MGNVIHIEFHWESASETTLKISHHLPKLTEYHMGCFLKLGALTKDTTMLKFNKAIVDIRL